MTTQARENHLSALKSVLFLLIGLGMSLLTAYAMISLAEKETALGWLFLLCLVQLSPLVVFFISGRPSYLMLIQLQTFLGFTISRYHAIGRLQSENLDPWQIAGLQERLICTLITICVYCMLRFFFFAGKSKDVKYEALDLSPRLILGAGLWSVVGFAFAVPFLPPSLMSLFTLSSDYCTLLPFASKCSERPGITLPARLLVGISLLFRYLRTESLLGLSQFGMNILILGCLYKNKRFLGLLPFLLAALLIAQSVKGIYRETTRRQSDLSDAQRVGLLSNLVIDKLESEEPIFASSNPDLGLAGDNDEYRNSDDKDLFWRSYQRMEDPSLERVMMLTPSEVPYWEGETYETILLIFIPRAIWPDKPARDFWNKFGRVYHIILPDDNMTSVAVNYLAEGYMNYGLTGLYLVAVVFGAFAMSIEWLGGKIVGRQNAFVYAFLLAPLINSYSEDLGSLLNTVAIHVFAVVITRRWLLAGGMRDEYA